MDFRGVNDVEIELLGFEVVESVVFQLIWSTLIVRILIMVVSMLALVV